MCFWIGFFWDHWRGWKRLKQNRWNLRLPGSFLEANNPLVPRHLQREPPLTPTFSNPKEKQGTQDQKANCLSSCRILMDFSAWNRLLFCHQAAVRGSGLIRNNHQKFPGYDSGQGSSSRSSSSAGVVFVLPVQHSGDEVCHATKNGYSYDLQMHLGIDVHGCLWFYAKPIWLSESPRHMICKCSWELHLCIQNLSSIWNSRMLKLGDWTGLQPVRPFDAIDQCRDHRISGGGVSWSTAPTRIKRMAIYARPIGEHHSSNGKRHNLKPPRCPALDETWHLVSNTKQSHFT